MKTTLQIATVIVIAAIAFGISGCKKVYDFIGKNPDGDMKYCNIKTFIPVLYKYDYDTAVFKYNSLGNPESITIKNPRTGYPNRLFLYDKFNRLTDYIGTYSGASGFEYWHKYFYSGNKIISDSMFVFGKIKDNKPVDYVFFTIITYEYDFKNRISKVVYVEQDGRTSEQDFSYDSKGNLIGPAYLGYVYDDKINLHRTNKIWMFIDKDYSKNNPKKAQSYNLYNLPTSFKQEGSFLDFSYVEAEVEYWCK